MLGVEGPTDCATACVFETTFWYVADAVLILGALWLLRWP